MSTWSRTGFEFVGELMRLKMMQNLQPPRLVLRKGDEKHLVFLDGDGSSAPFVTVEHRKKVNGAWTFPVCQNAEIILAGKADGFVECYGCDEASQRHFVGMLTVIDIEGYAVEGKEHRGLRRIYPGDETALQKLDEIRVRECGGDLAGAIIVVKEDIGDWGSVGTSFTFKKKIPKGNWAAAAKKAGGDISKNPWEPFNYASFVKLVSNDTMRSIWAGKVPESGPATDDVIKY
jgi:hypothetical protein